MGSFFDRFERPSEPEEAVDLDEPDYEQPDWAGHPHAVLPGRSNQVASLFRTDTAALVICCIDAYPPGLEFSLRILLATSDRRMSSSPFHFGHFGESDPSAAVRIGVEFADGRCWSNVDPRAFFPHPPEPDDIVAMNRGGNGGGRFWELDVWLWPLPPDGPLTFHADWPSRNVPESSTTIDATELRALAQTAVAIGLHSPPPAS